MIPDERVQGMLKNSQVFLTSCPFAINIIHRYHKLISDEEKSSLLDFVTESPDLLRGKGRRKGKMSSEDSRG